MNKNLKQSDLKSIKKTIYIVGTNGLPVRYGGWDMLLHNFTLTLSKEYDIHVYTSSFEAIEGIKSHNGAKIDLIPFKANGFQSIIYDFVSMLHASFKRADYILVLGVSGGIFFPIFKLFNSKVILNPDGAEWKRTKFNKFVKNFLKLSEKIAVKFSDKVITDNKVMSQDIMNSYNVDSSVIEYGGDHVKKISLSNATASYFNIKSNNYAFKVCRIVPENNIEMILEAFSKTQFKLILIGNWKNSQFGIDIRKKYLKNKNLLLLDPIYDQEKLDELRSNCRVYIHGHSVGGTNPSLVEAMHLGLPCLIYGVSYNVETTESCAEYFLSEKDILTSLPKLWDNEELINLIGSSMLQIAKKRYLWSSIISKYKNVIESD